MNKGLYIHIPCCRRKCAYCDFYSLPSDIVPDAYVDAVVRNIRAYNERYDTVYIGGGTPSLLTPAQLFKMLSAADICGGAEISVEVNPDSADRNKLASYRSAGVNRVSIGIQSLEDRELKMLSRLHSSSLAAETIIAARQAGFDNISADLMLGLPMQTPEIVKSNIRRLSQSGVTHISAYMLKIEDGTPFSENKQLCSLIDDELTAEIYENAVNELAVQGYGQYEISNFARKGYECRHNLNYWRCGEYIGIGAAAHSHAYGARFAVARDADDFIRAPLQNTVVTDSSPASLSERIMLSLRLTEGFPLSQAGEYAENIRAAAAALAISTADRKLLWVSGDRIGLTSRGFLLSNEIIVRILSAVE